jgi:hypothetical protein
MSQPVLWVQRRRSLIGLGYGRVLDWSVFFAPIQSSQALIMAHIKVFFLFGVFCFPAHSG